MAEEQKSLGRKILSFFVEEAPAPANTPTPASGNVAPSGTVPAQAATIRVGTGEVAVKFVEHFADVMDKANLPGPDYFEFMQTLKGLSSLGLSEDKQFQAAWASFKAMGNVKDVSLLATTASQYLQSLSGDRDSFLKSVQNAINERVGGLNTEQKNLTTENETLKKQIADLQARITSNSERLSKISIEIAEQSTKIEQNRNDYEATYAYFTEQIKGDVDKIKRYLS
jgi:gas vesicle protein